MARVEPCDDRDVSGSWLVEGFPGVGLAGKIAADHLVETLSLTEHATVHCEGLPRVGVYETDDHGVHQPVRVHAPTPASADGASDGAGPLVLSSDVPVSPSSASGFAACVTGWFEEHDLTPLLLSGLPAAVEKDSEPPGVFGVASGDAVDHLDRVGLDTPPERGAVSGPTGALLNRADEVGLDAAVIVVEADPRFPDPEAARRLVQEGVEPLTGVDVAVDELTDRAEEIRQGREQLAKRMQEADDESSKAGPLRMYQ
ncbi:3-isopropylmalate dehydratase [Halobacteriales archaeon SW_5_70_135]|nr:MAG: 3-isopropylmalate dehydratase [Halobacteriales archaeon SW_5_70_135]